MSLHYTCDGPKCGAKGEPRGPARALPEGWVCVVIADRYVMDLCLKCEMKRREEAAKR